MNTILTSIPSIEEIIVVVFGLKEDNFPGPDGFGGSFFQTYWSIIHDDVCKEIWKFFKTGWMLPNLNANIIMLIPKTTSMDSMENFRPIALSKIKYSLCLASEVANLLDKKSWWKSSS
ncbi:unnamed protein product [Vicia faba]|uniref:Uncharacterized protein n=1 Tax=Vicia faba TaxID=3906 RepID=A0AAV0YIH0_VICFA|nr:unnamed protein product [Vicia faba]